MGKVYSVFCRKGGVGKTTFATNLISFLSRYVKKDDGTKCKCLLIDIDNQGNASQSLGMDSESLPQKSTIVQVFIDEDFDIKNLILNAGDFDIIPSNSILSKADRLLVRNEDMTILRKKIIPLKNIYDYIIIDMPPAISPVAENGLVASDEIIIPIQPEKFAFEGLGEIFSFIERINEDVKQFDIPSRKIMGVVYNLVSKKSGMHEGYVEQGRKKIENSGYYCFNTILHDYKAVPESQDSKKTIFEYDMRSKSAKEFAEFGKEFISLENKKEGI